MTSPRFAASGTLADTGSHACRVKSNKSLPKDPLLFKKKGLSQRNASHNDRTEGQPAPADNERTLFPINLWDDLLFPSRPRQQGAGQ